MTQMPVTNWPERIALTLLVIAVMVAVFVAMRRGWVARGRRQAHIPAPATRVGDQGSALLQLPGRFIGTSTHGDWLDRVVVHDLGVPSRATLLVHPQGVHFRREGARDVAIPVEDIVEVKLSDAVGADVVDHAIVITWALGSVTLDTGFRASTAEGHAVGISAITSVVAGKG